MALSSKPSLTQISNEFGNSTKNALAFLSLRNFYVKIFGSVTSGVSAQSDFGGRGKAVVDSHNMIEELVDGSSVDVSFNISAVNFLEVTCFLEYQEDDGSLSPFDPSNPNPIQTSNQFSYATTGRKEITISGLDFSSQYFVRVVWWNDFNDHVNDWERTLNSDALLIESGPAPQLTAPTIRDTIEWLHSQDDGYFRLEWDTTDVEPTSYQCEFQHNGGTITSAFLINTQNWNQDPAVNPKRATADTGIFFNVQNDSIQFRIRGTRSGYTDSAWSGWRTYTRPISDPTVTTLSADQVEETSMRLRMTISSFTSSGEYAGQTYQYRWRYRVKNTSTWTYTPWVTGQTANTTHTRNQTGLTADTTYEYQAMAQNQASGTTIQYGSTLETKTNAVSLNPPTGVTVSMIGFGTASGSWTAPSGSPTGYDIDVSANGGAFQREASNHQDTSISINACSYGSNGQDFQIRVRAKYSGGDSSFSNSNVVDIENCF